MASESSDRRTRRPSPALVVSIVALVIATTGTALGAGALIHSSSQLGSNVVLTRAIKNGTIKGADMKNGAVNTAQLHDRSVDSTKLAKSVLSGLTSGGGVKAYEAFNSSGPSVASNTAQRIATLSNLPPGPYAIFAKTVIARSSPNSGLFNTTGNANCTLDAQGDTDRAAGPVSGPGLANGGFETQATLNMQILRGFDHASDVTLTCDTNFAWIAANTSIIAISLSSAGRTVVGG